MEREYSDTEVKYEIRNLSSSDIKQFYELTQAEGWTPTRKYLEKELYQQNPDTGFGAFLANGDLVCK